MCGQGHVKKINAASRYEHKAIECSAGRAGHTFQQNTSMEAVAIVVACMLYSAFAVSGKRHMAITPDVYCGGGGGSVLRQSAGTTALRCAGGCSRDAQCVAYSWRASECLLHDDFCSSGDMVDEAGAIYVEVKWECFGASCYYIPTLKTPKTKAEADEICEAMGAHIVALETAEENENIGNLAQPSYIPAPGTNGQRHIWIDLVDDVRWQHSGENAAFTGWAGAEPDGPAETCTVFTSYGWWDVDCSRVHVFMCEV